MKVTWLPLVGMVATLGCGSGGGGDDEGGDDRIDAGSQPGGPAIASLTVNRASITEGGAVTFTAAVTDPDGVDDIIGGALTIGDAAAPAAAFVEQFPGTYTVEITWDQIAAVDEIEFTADETRRFRAEFLDNDVRRGSRDATLLLTCHGMAACDSRCVDLQQDVAHCGTCGTTCRVAGDTGGCSAGECEPALTECLATTQFASCDAACAAIGETCGVCGGVSALYYITLADCGAHRVAAAGASCSEAIRTDAGNQARCCCAP
jgi:hypothetical protein